MTLDVTVLGCGNSLGVPAAGNYWGTCDPSEPKNRRFKCALVVRSQKTTLIVDTGVDFRTQMNLNHIETIDYVLYTHHHSDHTHGIDDIRAFFFRNGQKAIPCFGSRETLDRIQHHFAYLFEGGEDATIYKKILDTRVFEAERAGVPVMLGDVPCIPFDMDHGTCTSTGYRFGDISYCVDMKRLDDKALEIIKGSRIWIVDGAGYHNAENHVHADFETLYHYNRYVQAEQVYITCLSHTMDYRTLLDELPDGFAPAYDGLTLTARI